MLDYLHYPPERLLQLLQPHTGPHLVVCVLDMCAYVVNAHVLGAGVPEGVAGGCKAGVPRWCIVFDEGHGGRKEAGMVARVATEEEQQVRVVCQKMWCVKMGGCAESMVYIQDMRKHTHRTSTHKQCNAYTHLQLLHMLCVHLVLKQRC